MQPNVIDISHHNDIADFAALKAGGVLGVIHKCTEGSGYVDRTYAPRRKRATDAGLLWGAYTFNSGQPTAAQWDNFMSHAEPDVNTLMCLDFEDNPRSNMSLDQARHFLEEGDTRLGRKLVLYSGNRVKDLLGSQVDPFLGSHRLWLAQYASHWVTQKSWDKPWLWQYSEHGSLPGTSGLIDLNLYAGTPEQLAQEWAA